MSVLGLSLGILTLLGVVISNSVIAGLPSGFAFAGVAFLGLILSSADKNSKGLRAAAQVVCIVSIGVNGVIGYSFYDTVKVYQERTAIIDESMQSLNEESISNDNYENRFDVPNSSYNSTYNYNTFENDLDTVSNVTNVSDGVILSFSEDDDIFSEENTEDSMFSKMIHFCKHPWVQAKEIGAPHIQGNFTSDYFIDLSNKTYSTQDGNYYSYVEIADELKNTYSVIQDNAYELYNFSKLTTESKQTFIRDLFKCANAYVCAEQIKQGGTLYDSVPSDTVRDLYTSLYYLDSMNDVIYYDIIMDTHPAYANN